MVRPTVSLSASTKNRFVLVQAEAHNAELAAKHAARQANTMIPGISGFVEVQQLAIPNDLKTNKEEAFIQQVLRIGEFMNVPLTELFLHTIGKKNHCLEIRAVAERIFADYPTKFLAGFSVCERAQFQQTLAKFWDAFQRYYPNHPVLTMAISFVHACLSNFTAMRERAFAAQAFINLVGGQSCMRTFPACLATFSGPVWAMKLTKKLTQGLRKAMRCLMNSANTLHGRQLKFTGKGLMQATWAGFIWLLCLMRVTCQRKPGHTTPSEISIAAQIKCVLGA